jgi:uncharacterized protein YyaL (SSP411 family)
MSSPSVSWRPWSVEAFARARAERKPVLLSISTVWSEGCRAMDQTSYADPAIVDLIAERFVPIRVDADRRPDISERYALGGWPTTAVLTADGEVVAGGTYVAVDRLQRVLERILDAFETGLDDIPHDADSASTAVNDSPTRDDTDASLTTYVFETFDAEHGGFGSEPKLPLNAPIRLALDLYRDTQDDDAAGIAAASLDAMGWGGLYDEVDGGFFRSATSRNWQHPHLEKLLDVQASLIPLYVDAARLLGTERYADRAADALRYVQTWLADPVDGGWSASQCGDTAYYRAETIDDRSSLPAPSVDTVIYAGSNAAMVSAALRAAEVMEDVPLAEFAIRSLERVLMACYKPGAGVAHFVEDGTPVRGLLDDQLAIAGACLDAHEATGNIVYEMMAEEVLRYAVRHMWDGERGGFYDRAVSDPAESIGRMRIRLKPFVPNCQAAAVLYRTAKSSGENDFRDIADAALAAVAPTARRYGPDAAHYVLARRASQLR